MCLNEKLTYNVKIKSRNCELFVLKKNDFLRLSVNFKEFIENFLHKSLMIYLKFNEEKKKIMKEEESKMNKAGLDKIRQLNQKTNELDMISENKDEDEGSEYDMDSDYESDEYSESTDNAEDLYNNSNMNDKLILKQNEVNPNNDLSNTMKSKNEDSIIIAEEEDPLEKMKNKINVKFSKKIDRIVKYLEKNKIDFDNLDEDPKSLLNKLKFEEDIGEKNLIIDKIEGMLKDFYKKNTIS